MSMRRIAGFGGLLIASAALIGCGSSVEPPPELTEDVQAQIEQEDREVEAQERAQ